MPTTSETANGCSSKMKGDDTQIALSSGGSGQQQNQSTGFSTGAWSRPPPFFGPPKALYFALRVRAARSFISIHGDQIESTTGEPKLESAEKLTLNWSR